MKNKLNFTTLAIRTLEVIFAFVGFCDATRNEMVNYSRKSLGEPSFSVRSQVALDRQVLLNLKPMIFLQGLEHGRSLQV